MHRLKLIHLTSSPWAITMFLIRQQHQKIYHQEQEVEEYLKEIVSNYQISQIIIFILFYH